MLLVSLYFFFYARIRYTNIYSIHVISFFLIHSLWLWLLVYGMVWHPFSQRRTLRCRHLSAIHKPHETGLDESLPSPRPSLREMHQQRQGCSYEWLYLLCVFQFPHYLFSIYCLILWLLQTQWQPMNAVLAFVSLWWLVRSMVFVYLLVLTFLSDSVAHHSFWPVFFWTSSLFFYLGAWVSGSVDISSFVALI